MDWKTMLAYVTGSVDENSLRHVLSEYLAHYHTERCHQGLGNVMSFPATQAANDH